MIPKKHASKLKNTTTTTTTASLFFRVLFLACVAAHKANAYRYYGGYARPAVVVARPVVVVRRGRWGRKLLQENAGQYTPSGDCQSMLEIIKTRPGLSKLASVVDKLPRISAALDGDDDGKTVDTFFAPTNKAIDGFLQWTQARNKTEEFGKILGNQTVAGAILAYHALPEFVYKFGILKEFDRKFINTALSDAVSDTTGAFALQIDEEGGSIFVKGTGSEVKVIGADNYACNGIIHLVDGVLLPFDANGELSEKQIERLEDAKEMLSEAIEEEEEMEEEEMEGAAAPAPAPAPDAVFSIGLLTDLGSGGEAPAPSPSTAEILEEIIDIVENEPPEPPAAAPEEDVVEPEEEKEDLLQAELDEGFFNITVTNDTTSQIPAANETTTSTSD